ncbi:hypothetical protein OCO53_22885 [Peribacillus frigoritolerans]|uniref:hypothetical protein n=1 Tax=Peribacillus frigoritolerans TaxID=450367 RepID=UPI0021D1B7FA|nr:hypothetical protein [Peribacillus frigoritolerans]MCU6603291.1 hypothetical protein [Peribacillus frigoritolerans]
MPNKLKLSYPSWFYTVILNGLKRYTTLQPNKLASRDPTGACAEETWQTVGGKGADFLIKWNNSDE